MSFGDTNCHSLVPDNVRTIFRVPSLLKQELKTVIAGHLLVVILLTTVLSYAIMMVFWLRSAALSFSREKEVALVSLLEHLGSQADQEIEIGTQWPSFLPVLIERAGAIAGCTLGTEGGIFCAGQQHLAESMLKERMARVQQSSQKERALSGAFWVGFIPAKRFFDLAVPWPSPSQGGGVLSLRYSLEPVCKAIASEQRYIGLYLLVNLLVLGVIGFFRFRQAIIRPVEYLVRLTDSYSDEHGVPFLALEDGNQLGQLARSMQQMLDRICSDQAQLRQHVASLEETNKQLIRTREEMIRTEKLTSVGRLAAGLAHEIGNPAGIVQGYLGLMQRQDLTEQERADFCSRAEQEMQRIIRLVRQLLDLARPADGGTEKLDVHHLLQEVVTLMRPQPLMNGIAIVSELRAPCGELYGNPSQLFQVFLNCLINAADSIHATGTKTNGKITLTTDLVENNGRQFLQVCIIDDGAGLSGETLVSAFDPFYTTKEPGKGTGLGLSVSNALIASMGGSIHLENASAESGAIVSILLPISDCERDSLSS